MRVRVRGPHPLRPGIQPGSPGTWFYATDGRPVGAGKRDPSTPRAQPPTGITRARFGLIRFRSPLLTEYPFLQVLRCFTSLRTPRTRRYRPMTAGGFPHSEILGSKPCRRLPEAYRSLKRPSSVLSAKASTIRPCKQHTPRGCMAARFLLANSQTTNHHTKNDHKTIETNYLEFDSKSTAKQRFKQCSARVHYPVLKPPRTRTHDQAGNQSGPTGHGASNRARRKPGVAIREPKSASTPLHGTSHDGRTESP